MVISQVRKREKSQAIFKALCFVWYNLDNKVYKQSFDLTKENKFTSVVFKNGPLFNHLLT